MRLRTLATLAAAACTLAALPAWAQDAAAPAPTPNQGDVAWMLTATALVLMMSIPGLALFYGGLVRAKNMLSVLTQVFLIVCVAALVWVSWGYSLAFTSGSPFFGGLDKAFLRGVTSASLAGTFSAGVVLPEFLFIAFQMTFACITPALIVGAFAERIRFTPLILFVVLWLTFAYFPIAHMVWYWDGPDALVAAAQGGQDAWAAATANSGYLFNMGALDFAGGTVVHINAGVAGLVGCLIVGKRVGYGREAMPPHSMTLTMVGAALLWVGWFGFNAGSNLEANAVAAVAFLNTFVATAAAAVAWVLVEQVTHGKPSLLGAVTGAVAGLVAVTPASGFAGPMGSVLLGLVAGAVCFWFCTWVKNRAGYDDSLDVFGVHAVGGIIGALATGVLVHSSWGGQGIADYLSQPGTIVFVDPASIAGQVWIQLKAVLITMAWTGFVSAVLFFAIDRIFGLRPPVEAEREGLDLTEHGERAYNY